MCPEWRAGQEVDPVGANDQGVRPKHQTPRRCTTRPPEPSRPAPAQRTALSLVAIQARRRRRRPFLL